MAKYPHDDGEWFQPDRRGFKQMCCSCGLVHTWEFRVANGKVEARVTRNERATQAARRHLRKKILIVED